ncbi:MAG: NADPH:quinone oxidoreductase family protein [Sphingobium sp.]
MDAWLSLAAGGPETLVRGEAPDPVPGPGQVLVRVGATALNHPDALMIEDFYQFRPQRPFAPGMEVAGTVLALGDGVDGLKAGDRVCALCGHGGLAERVAVDAWKCFAIPDAMPLDIAAALLMTYGTSIHALLDRLTVAAGETMLVLGAAGGIGLSAVDLGKALGARVVAGVSSPGKAEAVRAAGADAAVVYPPGPLDKAASRALADAFKAECPAGYAVILDPVGGPYAEPALRAIGWEGRYGVAGFTAGIAALPLNLPLLKACGVVGIFWGSWIERNRARFAEETAMLFDLWGKGLIAPRVSRRFAFAEAPAALARMKGRGAIGKLVVMRD